MREALARTHQRLADAKKEAASAATRVDIETNALHLARLAGKRVTDILTVFDDNFPAGGASVETAEKYARCLASALLWEHQNEDDKREKTAQFIANVFPDLGTEVIEALSDDSVALTNVDVGKMLKVTLADVDRLSLTMITPHDVTAKEFKAYRHERTLRRDRIRKADAARAAGKPTIEERRAMEAEKKACLEGLAKAHGKTVGQIRRDIKSGKIPTEAPNANLGSARGNNRLEFTFASSVMSAAGALKAPPADASDSNPSHMIATELFPIQERREKISAILLRAAENVRAAS